MTNILLERMIMRKTIGITLIALLLWGCGKYKHLKPNPEIVPRESGYTEIIDKDKPFELKQNKRYFMTFPAPASSDYYLVVQLSNGTQLSSYLTQQFDKKPDTQDPVIKNDSKSPNVAAYPVEASATPYTWVIDRVDAKTFLNMEYRYVPRWRYQFETKYASFQTILAKNKADRQRLQGLGTTVSISTIDFAGELSELDRKTETLKKLQAIVLETESIFPGAIKGSDDRAYLDYLGIKREVDDELRFQDDYRIALKALQITRDGRLDNELFIRNLPEIMRFFENENRYPENVRREVADAVANRLTEIVPYYESQVQRKRDLSKIDFPANAAKNLYDRTNQRPDQRFSDFTRFVDAFNRDLDNLQTSRKKVDDLRAQLKRESWPSASFYSRMRGDVNRLQSSLPTFSRSDYGKYTNYSIVSRLENEVRGLSTQVNDMARGLGVAESLAGEINMLKDSGNYRGIIRLLKQHSDIAFLRDQYGDLDQRSIDQQEQDIRRALQNQNFADAERRIEALYNDRDFIDYDAFAARKLSLCKEFEEQMLAAIEQASKERVTAFIAANQGGINNVDELYNSEAFQPVHKITFSAGGQNVIDKYNQRLQQYMDGLKFDQFPKSSIEAIYGDFTRSPHDNGIAKARAVITHGKYYKGNDRKVKNMIAELDPAIAKWITKPTEYRRIFVVPVNAAQQANNSYTFRVNLQIPSDAKFPVFDVNIKLPREVAKSAGTEQWYQSMTLNGKQLKNEGRFTITAPTERNDFECQITPLQVRKDGDNILEVKFNHAAFKVLEISVMAQRPIIRRD